MSNLIDQEIYNLSKKGQTPSTIAVALIELFDSSIYKKNKENIFALSAFLVKSGQEAKLISYVLENLDNKDFPVPWAYFLEALTPLAGDIEADFANALTRGIIEQKAEVEAVRSQGLDSLIPETKKWREQRHILAVQEFSSKRSQMMDQLSFLRAQRLYEQEKELLKNLQRMFPNDAEINAEINEHQQRYAIEILSRKKSRSKTFINESINQLDESIQNTLDLSTEMMKELAVQDPNQALDFSVAAFMMEAYEEAYELLLSSPEGNLVTWYRLEVLLKTRRFIELLSELSLAEKAYAEDPETFFATAYLRAQALWGLGQKSTAREVLEGLLAARPNYRSASSLYRQWSV